MGEARDPALDQLDVVVGEWDVEATHPSVEGVARGRSVFEWLTGRSFLVMRSDMERGEFPSSISIIGGGDTPGTWPMHYFDSRGVMRMYQVTFERGELRIWRDDPEFSQRFGGVFEAGGRTLRGQWEARENDRWNADLRIVYQRR